MNVCKSQVNATTAQVCLSLACCIVHEGAITCGERSLLKHLVLVLVDGVSHLFKVVLIEQRVVCVFASSSFSTFKPRGLLVFL